MKVKIFILAFTLLIGSLPATSYFADWDITLTEKSNSKTDKKKSDKDDSEEKDDEKSKDSLKERIKEKLREGRDKREGGRFGDKRF